MADKRGPQQTEAHLGAVTCGPTEGNPCSLGLPLLIGDVIRGKGASVAGPNAADVSEG